MRFIKLLCNNTDKVYLTDSYKTIDYGYALTVHKSQGMTSKNVHVLIDNKLLDKHLSFVAMTRHKESLKLYVNESIYSNLYDLKRALSRTAIKDNVLDWPISYAARCGLNPDKIFGKVVNAVADKCVRNDLKYEKLQEKYPLLKEYDELLKKRQYLSRYYQEKIDKKIIEVVKNITGDKVVMKKLQNIAPLVCKKISGSLLKHIVPEL